MPDFPTMFPGVLNNVTFSNTDYDLAAGYIQMAVPTFATGTYTNANTAVYSPFAVQIPTLITNMAFQVTTQAGNIDIGIYDEKGTRIVSSGSTACAAAGLQVVNITDTWLVPGTYYAAFNSDNASAAFQRWSVTDIIARFCCLQQQAVGALALPATATFATWTTRILPIITLTGNATI